MPENIGSFFLPVFAQHFMQKSAMTSKTDLPLRSDIIDKGVEECKRRLERSYHRFLLPAWLLAHLRAQLRKKPEAKTTLVNVAVNGTVSTQNGENGSYVIGNINDGDPKTSWQTQGTWPATAVIQLDKGRSISKVAVELGEDGDNSTGRTALVTVQYAQNGITTDLIDFGSKRMTVDSKEEFTADVPKSATHIYVTLSDPQNSDGSQGAFWPSVQEVEVFEEQEEKVSDYNNIANQAKITNRRKRKSI